MSLFRNAVLFRFSPAVARELSRLDEALADHRLRSCGPLEAGTRGFVAPVAQGDDAPLTHAVKACTLVAAGSEEKILPAAVVNDELHRKVQKIAEEEGRKVGGRERKRIKEDLLTELLPRAFVRRSRTAAFADTRNGWFVVDTSSRKTAETILSQVREALGSFPAVPLAPEEGPRVLMTDWLANGTLPAGLSLGDECELRDPATATGAISRSRRQDLDAEDIKEHLRQGKQVFQLGLVFDDRLSFVLGEDLVIRKLKFLDVAMDELPDSQGDSHAEADATFALLTLELERLLAKMEEWFGLPRPSDDGAEKSSTEVDRALPRESMAAFADSIAKAAGPGGTVTISSGDSAFTIGGSEDPLFSRALESVRETGRASISAIQRHLQIGYNHAARLIEQLEAEGHVSGPGPTGDRTVLQASASA